MEFYIVSLWKMAILINGQEQFFTLERNVINSWNLYMYRSSINDTYRSWV